MVNGNAISTTRNYLLSDCHKFICGYAAICKIWEFKERICNTNWSSQSSARNGDENINTHKKDEGVVDCSLTWSKVENLNHVAYLNKNINNCYVCGASPNEFLQSL